MLKTNQFLKVGFLQLTLITACYMESIFREKYHLADTFNKLVYQVYSFSIKIYKSLIIHVTVYQIKR